MGQIQYIRNHAVLISVTSSAKRQSLLSWLSSNLIRLRASRCWKWIAPLQGNQDSVDLIPLVNLVSCDPGAWNAMLETFLLCYSSEFSNPTGGQKIITNPVTAVRQNLAKFSSEQPMFRALGRFRILGISLVVLLATFCQHSCGSLTQHDLSSHEMKKMRNQVSAMQYSHRPCLIIFYTSDVEAKEGGIPSHSTPKLLSFRGHLLEVITWNWNT